MSQKLKERYQLAGQIAFEYPNFGQEHISDMYQTYKDNGEKPPCTYDELETACYVMRRLKKDGFPFGIAVNRAVEEHE